MYKYVVKIKMTAGNFDHRTFQIEFISKDDDSALAILKEYVNRKQDEGWRLKESELVEKITIH